MMTYKCSANNSGHAIESLIGPTFEQEATGMPLLLLLLEGKKGINGGALFLFLFLFFNENKIKNKKNQ